MPLYWVMSSVMVFLFIYLYIMFFGNYLEVEKVKNIFYGGKKINKWLW